MRREGEVKRGGRFIAGDCGSAAAAAAAANLFPRGDITKRRSWKESSLSTIADSAAAQVWGRCGKWVWEIWFVCWTNDRWHFLLMRYASCMEEQKVTRGMDNRRSWRRIGAALRDIAF